MARASTHPRPKPQATKLASGLKPALGIVAARFSALWGYVARPLMAGKGVA